MVQRRVITVTFVPSQQYKNLNTLKIMGPEMGGVTTFYSQEDMSQCKTCLGITDLMF